MNRFNYTQIPSHMMTLLRAYLDNHEPVGDFLTAVLTNNLFDACALADDTNVEIIPVYVAYLYNEAPCAAWGSPAKLEAWLNPYQTRSCGATITGTQNMCTRDIGHDGEHRCKAEDVDRRKTA